MQNIQVLERAFSILEYTAGKFVPVQLGEIAEATGLNHATAARIASTLCALGYLEQLGRKKGYILGTNAFELGNSRSPRSKIILAADSELDVFSETTGEYVCISVLRNSKRMILKYLDSTRSVQIAPSSIAFEESPYRSASGRLLLALAGEKEALKIFRSIGSPGEIWQEAAEEKDFLAQLAAIRQQDSYSETNNDRATLALPLRLNGKVIAVVATYIPVYRFKGQHEKLVRQSLEKLRKSIENNLKNG